MPYKIAAEKKPKIKFVKMSPIRAPRNTRMSYYTQLNSIVKQLKFVGERVKQMTESNVELSAINSYVISEEERIQARVNALSGDVSRQFTDRIRGYTDEKIKKNIAAAARLNVEDVIYLPADEELATLTTLRELFIAGNTMLIKTIPQKYFSELSQAISNNFRGISQVGDAKTLAGRIYEIGNISRRRAAFIARDQTAKATADFAQERSRHAGAKKYVWRTAKDRRVVGDPSGLYPKPKKGHGNHYARDGNIYYYDRPFADGLPGDAYGCRCYAEPVIDVEDLLL